MVHLGVGGQYVAEGGKAYSTDPEDVMVETKKMVSLFYRLRILWCQVWESTGLVPRVRCQTHPRCFLVISERTNACHGSYNARNSRHLITVETAKRQNGEN